MFEPNFHELEYSVPIGHGPAAVAAMRELIRASQPDAPFPMEVRTVAPDDAFFSSQHGTATTVISVSGVPVWTTGAACETSIACSASSGVRAHWGKLHLLTREQLLARYPAAETFIRIRREFDPAANFLNDHLRPFA